MTLAFFFILFVVASNANRQGCNFNLFLNVHFYNIVKKRADISGSDVISEFKNVTSVVSDGSFLYSGTV